MCVPEEGAGSPGNGVTDSCELPCGCWELIMGPMEERPVLLTDDQSPRKL
jgi:E3 ubiquitin-protein ligase NEDD4